MSGGCWGVLGSSGRHDAGRVESRRVVGLGTSGWVGQREREEEGEGDEKEGFGAGQEIVSAGGAQTWERNEYQRGVLARRLVLLRGNSTSALVKPEV